MLTNLMNVININYTLLTVLILSSPLKTIISMKVKFSYVRMYMQVYLSYSGTCKHKSMLFFVTTHDLVITTAELYSTLFIQLHVDYSGIMWNK